MDMQEPQHISEFSKGDIITRLENYSFIPVSNAVTGEVFQSRLSAPENETGIGKPYKYVGVLNGLIHLENLSDLPGLGKDTPFQLSYSKYQDGWTSYIDPKALFDESPLKGEKLEKKLDNTNFN